MKPHIRILGIRGVPAEHGGFETFAERLALFLVDRGWKVTVYCQQEGDGGVFVDTWEGVDRVHVPVSQSGPLGTIVFDWKSISHAARSRDPCLTLGYNTAVFCARLRLAGIENLINMDGIEWARAKWGRIARAWFWVNDWAGCWLGNQLIADHPAIADHLATRTARDRITMIPYGADAINGAFAGALAPYGVTPKGYLSMVARPEPENSILEVVRGFSARPRGVRLLVLGKFDLRNPYHAAVHAAASSEVSFPGAIYERAILQSIRFHSLAYVHGHTVGGTNPSLVEALGAGNAVIAHDNRFNRWVAGDGAIYFDGADQFDARLTEVLANRGSLEASAVSSRARHAAMFTWDDVLSRYEALLSRHVVER